jgi:hypothetical protein
LRRFIERPIIKAAQTRQFALQLSIRSFYPKGLSQEAQATKSLSYEPTPGIYNAAEKFPLTSTYLYVIFRANV